MIGVIIKLGLRGNNTPAVELKYSHLDNSLKSATTALANAKRNPHTPQHVLNALESAVADYEAALRKLQNKRVPFSVGMVTQQTTWGTTELTF